MPTYFKDSFAFLELVEDIVIPPGCSTFTSDAVNMYGNIRTDAALSVICPHLRQNERRYGHYHAPTLIRALEIVMTNNIIRFGDIYVRQISGTAMGKPPAPAWATIFKGLHKIEFFPYLNSSHILKATYFSINNLLTASLVSGNHHNLRLKTMRTGKNLLPKSTTIMVSSGYLQRDHNNNHS